jgi:hypothetical protein
MFWVRKSCLALIAGSVLSTVGCCYHAQHFGRARDIGWGEIGCDTCKSSGCGQSNCGTKVCAETISSPTTVAKEPPQGNSSVSVTIREPGRTLVSKTRETVEVRKTEKGTSDLPVYVLSPECVSNGIIVNPNPTTTIAPAPHAVAQETAAREVVSEKN